VGIQTPVGITETEKPGKPRCSSGRWQEALAGSAASARLATALAGVASWNMGDAQPRSGCQRCSPACRMLLENSGEHFCSVLLGDNCCLPTRSTSRSCFLCTFLAAVAYTTSYPICTAARPEDTSPDHAAGLAVVSIARKAASFPHGC